MSTDTVTEDGWIHLNDRPHDLVFHQVDSANVLIDAVMFGHSDASEPLPHYVVRTYLAIRFQAPEISAAVDGVLTRYEPERLAELHAARDATIHALT